MAKNQGNIKTLGEGTLSTSLTSFTDFVLSVGLPKVQIAEKILQMHVSEYSAHRDYYRKFREAVVSTHQGGHPTSTLDSKVVSAAGKHQKINFDHLLRGYQRFWASRFQERVCVWKTPTRRSWTVGHLTVRVNPELGFVSDGDRYLIKMYLKKEEPSPEQVRVILHLMQSSLLADDSRQVVGLLDVRRGRLFEASSFERRYEPLLRGEALSLLGMCRTIESQSLSDMD